MKKIVKYLMPVLVIATIIVICFSFNVFSDKSYALADGEETYVSIGNTPIYDSTFRLLLAERDALLECINDYSSVDINFDFFTDEEKIYDLVIRTEIYYQDAKKHGASFSKEEAIKIYEGSFVTGDNYFSDIKNEGLEIASKMKLRAMQELSISEEEYKAFRVMLIERSLMVFDRHKDFIDECINKKGMTKEEAEEKYKKYCNVLVEKAKVKYTNK